MPYFNIFNPLIRADGRGKTIHEKDSKIEKSRKSLSFPSLRKSWAEKKVDVETIALLITITIKILFYFFTAQAQKSFEYANLFVLK